MPLLGSSTLLGPGLLLGASTTYEKSGGGVASCVGVGAETVTHPAVIAKSGGGVVAGVGVGVETVSHPAVMTKTGGAVAHCTGTGILPLVIIKTGGAVVTCTGTGIVVLPELTGWPPLVTGPCPAPMIDIRGPFREPLMWVCGPTLAPLMLIRKRNSAIFAVRTSCAPRREGPLILPSPNNGEGFSQGAINQTLVQINHGLPFQPAGIVCVDNNGVIVEYAAITYPFAGTLEISFGFPFTGTIHCS